MKKMISIALILVMCLSLLAGCAQQEVQETKVSEEQTDPQPVVMPYGLEFGMTYDEAKAQHSDIPELDNAEANDGYFASIEWVSGTDFCEFYGIDPIAVVPGYAYSFNEKKELYEFYAMTDIYSESSAEQAFGAVGQYYANELGQEPEVYESDEELMAQWETDDYSHYVSLTWEDGTFRLMIVLHSFEYGLTD